MKKRNNKTIILVLIGILFVSLLCLFVLNYSKDDSSFSILEKKWINDNASNVVDISVYNDVPVFGKNGNGVIFDFLDDFTNKHGINFNRISYNVSSNANLKDVAFKIVDGNTLLSNKDIIIYEDKYVLVSNENVSVDSIKDMDNLEILVLSNDVGLISGHLIDAPNATFIPKDKISDIETSFKNKEYNYAIVPYNMYLDFILKNELNILYHITDASKKYVISVENKTLLGIMKKVYNDFSSHDMIKSYKNNFLNEYFIDTDVSETDKMSYNSSPYNVGYVNYMPFESIEDNEFVGTLSNYLSGFEDIYDVDFKMIHYDSIADMKKAFSNGELDLIFANFNINGFKVDTIRTISPFKEEYVVLSEEPFVINSVKGLIDKEVLTIKDSYINDFLTTNGIKYKSYDDSDSLIRKVGNNNIVVIDRATYDYYKNRTFSDYKEVYIGTLPNEYTFVIRDVNKNTVFAKMFSYYVSSVDYNNYKFSYNTNKGLFDFNLLIAFIGSIIAIVIIVLLVFFAKKKKVKETVIHNNDKLKYIDTMTSLKNRTYLNSKMAEWDDNVIYPQAFVAVDLNNIKYINDNYGHEDGDTVIKKAASILIVNQDENTDIMRTDGNEFLIYMVGYSEKDVIAYSRKIYKELKDLPHGYGATVGYSMIMDDVKTVDDAINEALLDMRNNKEKQKNE